MHILFNLEKTNAACNKVNKMIHRLCVFTDFLAFFGNLADVRKGDTAQGIFIIIPYRTVYIIILRVIVLYEKVKINKGAVLFAQLFNNLLSALGNK